MAQRSREELLAAFPDIAGMLDRVERLPASPRNGHSAPKRTSLTKTVKPCKGVKSYKAYDWGKAAQNPRNYADVVKGNVVTSKGRRR